MAEPAEQGVSVSTIFLESRKPTLPSLVLQVTRLVGSYMLWIGVHDGTAESKEQAVKQGSLCKDWAVAMPPRAPGMGANATSLFRSASSDNAFPMAQRLVGFGQGPELVLEAERGIVETLKELEK
ncbi:hypothetical protein CC1G_03197 [Coprinopsis cinerea okayama7|uniref:Proteasome assembly chaperone 3 n=1 Tax=Coprinopsis cinerea (strain Okayama-7 / 130 / ATCC MYA-4618 / FGSC 9003) TaxID=240176 RepID=A8N754_COPC7|nr:hypothetical protein CC1G_03197 [Coprinopsis cinerea okayama7\|eukprot:XP_001830660.1 hypothetical protein CC1G_03197 [Coprinopsis cinerea okayama7\